MCEMKKAGDVFDYTKSPIATWFFLENVVAPPVDKPPTDTGNPKPVDPIDDSQKPITGGNSGTTDPNNQATYACNTDDRKLYTTYGNLDTSE